MIAPAAIARTITTSAAVTGSPSSRRGGSYGLGSSTGDRAAGAQVAAGTGRDVSATLGAATVFVEGERRDVVECGRVPKSTVGAAGRVRPEHLFRGPVVGIP